MRLDWRQSILYVTVMGMEGCWLYAVMTLLNSKIAGSTLYIIGILLLYPLAFLFNLFIKRLPWPEVPKQGASWLLWTAGMLLILKTQLFHDLPLSDTAWLLSIPRAIVAVLYTFRPELLVLLSTAVVWWLGQRLARHTGSFTAMVSEFQFGLALLVITYFAASLLGLALGNSVPVALAFFLFALLGISVAHALENKSWLSGLYQGHWSGLLLICISLVLIIGLLVSAILTPGLLQLIWTAIKWVWGFIWGIIVMIMTFIASLMPEPEPVELPPMPEMPALGTEEGLNLFTIPEALRNGLRLGWSIMVIGVILFFLWRVSSDISRWLRRKLSAMADAEFEPLTGAFRTDFFSFFKRILLRLLGIRFTFRHDTMEESVPPGIASVRHIYRQFLKRAAADGYPRWLSQTPQEYYYALAGVLQEARGDVSFITRQYMKTRYGAVSPGDEELSQLGQSWHRVKQGHIKRLNDESRIQEEHPDESRK